MSDSPPLPGATMAARFHLDAGAVQAAIARLSENFDSDEVAIGAAEATGGLWSVTLYFRQEPNRAAIRALVTLSIGSPEAANALTFERIEAKDWVKASLEGLKPVPAGRFVIHGAHDRGRVDPSRIGIEIEAALAFGTGHHGTTRGCLLAFDALLKRKRPRRVLDLGTGTGILAIAAAKATRRHILASDIDKSAVAVARANAKLNRAGNLVEIMAASGLGARRLKAGPRFDLVFANILVGPLKLLAAPIARQLAPGGHILLSGLLPEHANAAISAYRMQGLVLERRLTIDNWATLVMRREAGRKCNRPGRGARGDLPLQPG